MAQSETIAINRTSVFAAIKKHKRISLHGLCREFGVSTDQESDRNRFMRISQYVGEFIRFENVRETRKDGQRVIEYVRD